MDAYISRSLKNWAARQRIPGGRAALLRKAVAPSEQSERSLWSLFAPTWPVKYNAYLTSVQPAQTHDWPSGSMTASHVWFFFMAATWQPNL